LGATNPLERIAPLRLRFGALAGLTRKAKTASARTTRAAASRSCRHRSQWRRFDQGVVAAKCPSQILGN
jgi:hypothetical protein